MIYSSKLIIIIFRQVKAEQQLLLLIDYQQLEMLTKL